MKILSWMVAYCLDFNDAFDDTIIKAGYLDIAKEILKKSVKIMFFEGKGYLNLPFLTLSLIQNYLKLLAVV